MLSTTPPITALTGTKPAPRIAQDVAEVTVDFDEVQLLDGAYPVFSWRATVAYTDLQNYVVQAIELPLNYFFDAFVEVDRLSPLWLALCDRTMQLRDRVEAVIQGELDDELDRLLPAAADPHAEHRLSGRQLGVGRSAA